MRKFDELYEFIYDNFDSLNSVIKGKAEEAPEKNENSQEIEDQNPSKRTKISEESCTADISSISELCEKLNEKVVHDAGDNEEKSPEGKIPSMTILNYFKSKT
jgi:hypothetical protein